MIAALVKMAGPAWPAVFGTAVALVAWFEIRR